MMDVGEKKSVVLNYYGDELMGYQLCEDCFNEIKERIVSWIEHNEGKRTDQGEGGRVDGSV